jgi:hypothetical protein
VIFTGETQVIMTKEATFVQCFFLGQTLSCIYAMIHRRMAI